MWLVVDLSALDQSLGFTVEYNLTQRIDIRAFDNQFVTLSDGVIIPNPLSCLFQQIYPGAHEIGFFAGVLGEIIKFFAHENLRFAALQGLGLKEALFRRRIG